MPKEGKLKLQEKQRNNVTIHKNIFIFKPWNKGENQILASQGLQK